MQLFLNLIYQLLCNRNPILSLILISISLQLFSQDRSFDSDALREQLDQVLSSNLSDTLKYQILMDSTAKIDPVHSHIPFTYLKKGIDLATNNKDVKWRGELYARLGYFYKRLVKKDTAEIIHEKALLDFKQIKDTSRILDMHHLLSQMYGSNDAMDRALENAYATIAICEATGNKSELARANLNIAGLLFNHGSI